MSTLNAQNKPSKNYTKQLKLSEHGIISYKSDSGLCKGASIKTVKLTERIQLKMSPELHDLFRCSRNLYNRANTLLIKGTHMFVLTKGRSTQKAGKLIPYRVLERELKDEPEYRALPAQTSQQILKLLEKNWKSFFEGMTDWKEHPEKYKARPQPPGLKKDDFLLIFTSQQIRLKGNLIYFPRRTLLRPMKIAKERIGKLKQVRILPRGRHAILEIVHEYEVELPSRNIGKGNRIVALDLGVRNAICVVSNCGLRPFIVKGGAIKWINQYYNKQRAKLQKVYKAHGLKGQTRRLEQLDWKRNNKIEDLFHKLSRVLIKYCIVNDIGIIVIGYNEHWKQNTRLGRRNNQ
ncbi:MAG: RNA-guided endonuclease InsQ/TnpB family protein, partial [Promethearchaeota archaeon]